MNLTTARSGEQSGWDISSNLLSPRDSSQLCVGPGFVISAPWAMEWKTTPFLQKQLCTQLCDTGLDRDSCEIVEVSITDDIWYLSCWFGIQIWLVFRNTNSSRLPACHSPFRSWQESTIVNEASVSLSLCSQGLLMCTPPPSLSSFYSLSSLEYCLFNIDWIHIDLI